MNNGDSMPLQSNKFVRYLDILINLIFIIFMLILGTFLGMHLSVY